jgi:hypothetical protein
MKSAREESSFYKFYSQRKKNIDHRYRNSNKVNDNIFLFYFILLRSEKDQGIKKFN